MSPTTAGVSRIHHPCWPQLTGHEQMESCSSPPRGTIIGTTIIFPRILQATTSTTSSLFWRQITTTLDLHIPVGGHIQWMWERPVAQMILKITTIYIAQKGLMHTVTWREHRWRHLIPPA